MTEKTLRDKLLTWLSKHSINITIIHHFAGMLTTLEENCHFVHEKLQEYVFTNNWANYCSVLINSKVIMLKKRTRHCTYNTGLILIS